MKLALTHLNSQGLGVRVLFRHVLFPFTLTIKQLLLFLEQLTLEFCYLLLVVFQVAL